LETATSGEDKLFSISGNLFGSKTVIPMSPENEEKKTNQFLAFLKKPFIFATP